MSAHKIFTTTLKVLATVAFGVLQYLFIPFGALSGLFAGLILCGIWSPFFDPQYENNETAK